MLITGDVAVGPTIIFLGLAFGLMVFVPIWIVESLALWGLKWGSFGRALLDALIANGASTIFGLVFFTLFFSSNFQRTNSPILLFVAMVVLSILIEGGVLLLLKRHPPRKTWTSAIAANLASYALLGLLALVGALALPS